MRGWMKKITAAVALTAAFLLVACGSEETPAYYDFIGEIDYMASPAAFVYEQIDGEEDGFKGIQYHEVTDLGGITSQKEIAVCFYFYTSISTDAGFVTAGVEDLAQTLDGQVLVIAIDAAKQPDVSQAYEITAYPDFVLVDQGARISTFGSQDRGIWTMDNVVDWLVENGFTPNYALLGE